jgi:glycosyltransferase involved in cell wall biosynthesis
MPPSEDNVIHIISSLRRGGRERQLSILYKHTKNTDLKFRIICIKGGDASYVEEYEMRDEIVFLSSERIIGRYREIRKILDESGADIIWTWGRPEAILGLLLSIFTGVKHINGSIRHGILKFRLSHIYRMLVLQLSKYRVANSKAGLRANFLKRGFIWYNGIDDLFFKSFFSEPERAKLMAELALDKDHAILISVANLVPYKDYYTIIAALRKLKDQGFRFYYLIVGEGPERGSIETAINMNGLSDNIKLLGRRTDVKELLNLSDLFIHSSIGEGCSNAILEAMAAGKPIIATDVGGTPEIVDRSNALLFKSKHVDQLEDHLRTVLSDPEKRLQMGKNSGRIARERFSVKTMVDRYREILNSIR